MQVTPQFHNNLKHTKKPESDLEKRSFQQTSLSFWKIFPEASHTEKRVILYIRKIITTKTLVCKWYDGNKKKWSYSFVCIVSLGIKWLFQDFPTVCRPFFIFFCKNTENCSSFKRLIEVQGQHDANKNVMSRFPNILFSLFAANPCEHSNMTHWL